MDIFRRPRRSRGGIESFHSGPFGPTRQAFVHRRRFPQMARIAFLNIALQPLAARRRPPRRFLHRHAKVDDQILVREAENIVFESPHPGEELVAHVHGHAGALMGKVRTDVAVGQHQPARAERLLEFPLRLQPVAGIEQRREVRVHLFEAAEFAGQVPRDGVAEERFVTREAEIGVRDAAGIESAIQQFHLRAFAGTIDAFDRQQFSTSGHKRVSVARRCQGGNRSARGNEFPRAKIRPMPVDPSTVATAVARIRERIASAATQARRRPEEIRLVAVTKTLGAEAVRAAFEAGVRDFGENRVQEWEAKSAQVGRLAGATFHMIGHLQRNKARRAAALFDRVDSIDSISLARKLDQAAAEEGCRLPVLIEVRLSEEPAKSGIEPESLDALASVVAGLHHLAFLGLMTVPPWSEDPESARPYFRRLRELRNHLAKRLGRPLPVLSMGMTNDFEVAIEEGATEVRVGTAIFGRRSKPKAGNP